MSASSSTQLVLDQLKRSVVFTIKDKGMPRPPDTALEKLLSLVTDHSVTPSQLMSSLPDLCPSDKPLDIQFFTWIIDEADSRGVRRHPPTTRSRRSSRHEDDDKSLRHRSRTDRSKDRHRRRHSRSPSLPGDHRHSSRHRGDDNSRSRKDRKSRRSPSPSRSKPSRDKHTSHHRSRRSTSPASRRRRSSRDDPPPKKRKSSPRRSPSPRNHRRSSSKRSRSRHRSSYTSRSSHRKPSSRSRSRTRDSQRDRPSTSRPDPRTDTKRETRKSANSTEPLSPERPFAPSHHQSWNRPPLDPALDMYAPTDHVAEYSQHGVHPSRMQDGSYERLRTRSQSSSNSGPMGGMAYTDSWQGGHRSHASSALPPRPIHQSPLPNGHPALPPFNEPDVVAARPPSPPLITDPQPIPTYYEEFGAHLPPVPIPGTNSYMRGDTAVEYLSRTAAYDPGCDYSTMHLMDRFVGGAMGALLPNIGRRSQPGFGSASSGIESCAILCTESDRPPAPPPQTAVPSYNHQVADPAPVVTRPVAPLPMPGLNRCRHWPTCHYASQNGQCRFWHPQEICPAYPDCPYADEQCSGVHPRYFGAANDPRSNIFGSTLPFESALQRIQAVLASRQGATVQQHGSAPYANGPTPLITQPMSPTASQPHSASAFSPRASQDLASFPCKFGLQCSRNGCPYLHPRTTDRFAAIPPDSQVEKVVTGTGWGLATGEDIMRLDDLNVYDDEFFS